MRFTILAICSILSLIFVVPAQAQYITHVWNEFEANTLPQNLTFGHFGTPENIRPIPYAQVPPRPNMRGGIADLENGQGGIWFTPNNGEKHLSVLDKTYLVRDQLQQQGRALYQADFYLPPPGEPIPSMALIAAAHDPTAKSIYHFYRFGVTKDNLFFSFVNGKAAPSVYMNQKIADFGLTRPGWHRFQIIFVGNNQIVCAVDGKPTSFSPIIEPMRDSDGQPLNSLRRLNVGIMMTTDEPEEWVGTKHGFADNLSIQWYPYQAEIPLSPWTSGPVAVAGRSSSAGRKSQLMEVGSSVNWTGDSAAAWNVARRDSKPILALFYVPNIPPYEYLVELSPDDEATKRFLDQFILLRIDVNQLGGARAAQRFNITRTPTFVVVGPDGQQRERVVVVRDRTKWEDIVGTLQPTATSG